MGRRADSSPRRVSVAVLALCAVALWGRVGRAEQKTLLLVHRTPEAADCPDAAALAQAVHAIVGREVIGTSSDPAPTWIEVTMTRLKQGYFANVHTFGTSVGRRDISDAGPDCRGLSEAVAVSLALMWSSNDAGGPSTTPPDSAPSSAAVEPRAASVPQQVAPPPAPDPEKPAPKPAKQPASAPPRASNVSLGVEALVGVALEILENPVPGAELAGRLGIGERIGLSLGVGALGLDRQETADGVVELGLGYAYLGGCLGINRGSPRVAFCFRPMLGVLRGEGREFERSHSESVLYAALSAGAEVSGRWLGPISYLARATAVAPLTRNGFSVSDASGVDRVFTPPALGLLALIGVSWDHRDD